VITHPAAAPASSVPQTHYGICYGSPAGLPPTAYFSDPFEAPVPNVQAWSTTYRQVLRNQYKFMPNVHCSALKSLAEVQKMKDRMRVHWKIVETGWKNE
jgi:trans-aconitate methyltransferase